jgi:hypothetical protein
VTTRAEVEVLRAKIADKQQGLKVYLAKGDFSERWYKHGLEVQEATFDYMVGQLDKILRANSEPIR